MTAANAGRRMIFHGLLLFLLGLLLGVFVPIVVAPRVALSGHVGTLMTAIFMMAAGIIWDRTSLSPTANAVGFWSLLYGGYGSLAGFTLAAIWGASHAAPIAGAGHEASH